MGTELKNKNKALGMNSIFLWYHRHVNHYQTFFSKQSSSLHFNMMRVFSHQPMGPGKSHGERRDEILNYVSYLKFENGHFCTRITNIGKERI